MPIKFVQQPCKDWQDLLAARHPDDLSPSEHRALNMHLFSCPACLNAKADYDMLTRRIHELPSPTPQSLPQFALLRQEIKTMHDSFHPDPLPFPEPVHSTSRPSHFAHMTNGIAATLLLLLLVGSSLFLFSHRPATRAGTSIQPTAEPTHLIPQPLATCPNDPGIASICTKGYFKLVHISRALNGFQPFTMTVERVYADSNRVVIGYTVSDSQGKLPDGFIQGKYTITGTVSSKNDVTFKFQGKNSRGFFPTNIMNLMYITFDMTSSSSKVKELFLRLQIQLHYSPLNPGINPVTEFGMANFDLSMPFQQGYILYPHSTTVGHGMDDLAISNLSISLSQTNVTVTSKYTIDSWKDARSGNLTRFYMFVNGVEYYDLGALFSSQHMTQLTMTISEALYDKYGTWKIQFTTVNSAGKVVSTRTFQFTNPGP